MRRNFDNRALLQYVMAVKVVPQDEIFAVFQKLCENGDCPEPVAANVEDKNEDSSDHSGTADLAARDKDAEMGANSDSNIDSNTSPDLEDLQQCVDSINLQLFAMGFEIKKVKGPDQALYYTFVNLVSDAPAKLATEFNASEIQVVSHVVQKFQELGPQFELGSVELLNLYKEKTGKSYTQGENFLQSLVAGGWARKTEGNKYSAGVRMIGELGL